MKTFIIAEIGQAHEGSLGIAHSYIEALSETGVDAVKFQTHIAEAESSKFEPFRIKFSYEDDSRFDYWKRMEFTKEQWQSLKNHCEEKNIEFISSPFSNAAVDLLEQMDVKRYKIGSGEMTNFLLLEKIARTGKPIILSSGMSNLDELDSAINFLKYYNSNVSILQCTTAYPTRPGQWGLNFIQELKIRYNIPVGYSDHSGKVYPSIAAIAKGAEIIEFHVTFDKRMFGPDSKSSLTIDETKVMVEAIRNLEIDFNNPTLKELNNDLIELKTIFEKSLAVNKNLDAGHKITFDDLEAKKPKNYGIPASEYKKVIGRVLKHNRLAYSFIMEEDLL